ncbi:RNA binding methyltransferase FtsJ like [hydrothermal vent metagenome]|uniref:RNA binding methyltransferase FtsJ like n=1 Tax=hydrothermal vent metagenome TaxID=652676 RepID=A0A1W1BX13_9ZZZZ
MRIDKYLVENGYFESRNRALEAIKNGKIQIDGKIIKASNKVTTSSIIDIEDEKFYVSRAGRKLESFLTSHNINLKDKIALDIGSSTGGFAQILLENGVKYIDCVDVGKNQLHISLKKDNRVNINEETDIREFKSEKIFEVISCDVSFISILNIIEDIDNLASTNSDIIILYKPQFEVGKDVRRNSRGVVIDNDAIERKKEIFELQSDKLNWELVYKEASKVIGKSGNQEYMYHFIKR